MKLPFNPVRWCLLALIGAAALLAGNAAVAAPTKEERALSVAAKAFEDGFWRKAEKEFAQFVKDYPTSEHVGRAILGQAQAQVKQRKFAESIELLDKHQSESDKLKDQFLYWKGAAQFQNTNYAAAADTFGKLGNFETSPLRLEAAVSEAAAWSKLGDWPRAAGLLVKPEGAFQLAMRGAPESEWATRGFLLLAESQLQQRQYREAETALQWIKGGGLSPELAWQKQYLVSRAQLGDGRSTAALGSTSNLMVLAEAGGRADLLAESVAFRAGIFELLGQTNEASAMFRRNITNAVPERQRQALTKITELSLAQGRSGEAMQVLEQFLVQFTNAPATEEALLALGELHLKEYLSPASNRGTVTGVSATNHLGLALANFDRLIAGFPQSRLAGKAYLDRGWAFWSDKRVGESAEAFKAAIVRLGSSEDLAVAHFKLGDAFFVQKDFTNAAQHYRLSQETARSWPRIKNTLTSQSLYQVLRASLELKDMAGATNAMREILESYPRSLEADRSVLLVGEGFADMGNPDEARQTFQKFLELFPDSSLKPEVELALVRTAEQKSEWPAAIAQYAVWLERYATNRLRPQAEFHQAMAYFRTGNETNALTGLTNFVVRYPTNALWPLAQMALADAFFRSSDFVAAEINYKNLFQEQSELAYQARMMAGQAALYRSGYLDAITHFTNLTSNPNCPPRLRIEAAFAYGGTLMLVDPGHTNRLANFRDAIGVFGTIYEGYPGTEQAALAWGQSAICWSHLAGQEPAYYTNVLQAYQQVIESPQAGGAARSQARVGTGEALENWAARRSGEERLGLLNQAVDNYLEVIYGGKLRDGETPDLFWVKQAGNRAASLLTGALGEPEKARKLYLRLAELLPAERPTYEKRIAALQERAPEK